MASKSMGVYVRYRAINPGSRQTVIQASVPSYVFDDERLSALTEYKILETPPEKGFDDIVHLATLLCATPVSLVSLVTHDRQWFKARIGFAPCETDLSRSVCAHVLDQDDILVIPDLTKDDRTKANPLVVSDPSIRFYAGAPLRTDTGEVIGSLCVIDTVPRPGGLTADQAKGLRGLADQVMALMDLRRAVAEREAHMKAIYDANDRRRALLEIGDVLRGVQTIPDMTQTAARIVGTTLGASRAGFARFDPGNETITVEPDWSAEGVTSIAGTHRVADFGTLLDDMIATGAAVVVEDVDLAGRDVGITALRALGIGSLVNMAVQSAGRTVALFFVHFDLPHAFSPEVLALLRNVADRVEASVARVEAEEHQHVLNLELSHRMKNTFAMVQALATQTLRSVADRAPVAAFTQRIHALSTAHDVLLQQSWSAAPIRQIVVSVLGTLEKIERFTVQGPNLKIGPRATLSLSLLLHELSTNALKYGSLSAPAGRVEVKWFVRSLGFCNELVVVWLEIGGPTVTAPSGKGFGSKLIKMGLVGTGGSNIRYEPSGLVATFTAPLDDVQKS